MPESVATKRKPAKGLKHRFGVVNVNRDVPVATKRKPAKGLKQHVIAVTQSRQVATKRKPAKGLKRGPLPLLSSPSPRCNEEKTR